MATLAEARLAACDKRKYATYQILSLVPVCKPGLGTMAVDQHWRLYYDPAFIAGLSVQQAAGVILHEGAHLLFGHASRAQMLGIDEQTHRLWNVATDAAINSVLQAEGVELPPDGVFPRKLGLPEGKAAETYYDLLTHKQEEELQAAKQAQDGEESEDESEQPQDQEGDESDDTETANDDVEGGDGTPEGDNGQSGQDDPTAQGATDATGGCPDSVEPVGGSDSEGSGSGSNCGDAGDDQPVAHPGEGGSCSDGIQRPWEDNPPPDDEDGEQQAGDSENPAPRGVPEWEQKVILQQVAKAAEKFKGSLPGAMQEALDQILDPRVDPRKLLMRAVRAHSDNIVRTGAGRFTYRRPARRQGFGGTIRPSVFAPLPRITVIIDTSGSMGQRDLGMAVGLVANVLNGLRLRDGLRIVCADADVQWAGKVFDPSKIELRGRGGTDMTQAIIDVIAGAKRDEKPELIVLVSDGETGYPAKNVGVPVVACLTRKSRLYPVPAWMQTVYLKDRE